MGCWRALIERQVKEEVNTGNGGALFDADHEWIVFSSIMSKAIDVKKRRNAKVEQQFTPYVWPCSAMEWGLRGASSR